MAQKYRFRPIEISAGDYGVITWLTDAEIERVLRKKDGTPISTTEASVMFYSHALGENGIVVPVYQMGFIKYAESLGYRVDLFPDLILDEAHQ